MPEHQNQVHFDTYTWTKNISIPTPKPSQSRSLHWNQVKFDPNTKTKSFRPSHQRQVNFDPYTKNELLSIHGLKPSHFRSPHQNQVNSDTYTEFTSGSIPHDEIKSILTTHTKRSQVWCLHWNQVIFGQHTNTNSISTNRTKPRQSIPKLKTRHFRPVRKNQVKFRPIR